MEYKPIYEEQFICYEDENGIICADHCQVIVGYEPIYGYVSDSSIENEHSSKTK